MKEELKPAWWKLDGIVLLTIAILFLVSLAHLSTRVEKLTDLIVMLVAFWLMWQWCSTNELALEAEEKRRQEKRWQAASLAPQIRPLNTQQLRFRRVMTKEALGRKML